MAKRGSVYVLVVAVVSQKVMKMYRLSVVVSPTPGSFIYTEPTGGSARERDC